MVRPPVLVVLQNAQTRGLGQYPTLDLDPELPLGRKFLERLKAFGFDEIYLALLLVPTSWMAAEGKQRCLREFGELASGFARKSIAFEYVPDRESWDEYNTRFFTWCAAEFPADPLQPVLRLGTDAVFLDPGSLENLCGPLPGGILYRTWQGPGWETPACWTRELCRIRSTTGVYPPPAQRQVLESPIQPPALAPQIAFGARAEFIEVFRALEAKPVAEWGHEDLRALWATEPERFRGGFHHVGVELTNEDNLPRRLRAPARVSKRAPGRLSRKDWDALLAGLSDPRLQPLSIDIWDFGEPLLHPEAASFIEEAARSGIRVDLYTNGLLLDEAMTDRLIASGLDSIFYRLDAMTPETYGRVTGEPALHAKAVANLETLVKRKGELVRSGSPRRPLIAVQITEMSETEPDLDAFFDKYDHRGRTVEEEKVELGANPSEEQILAGIYAKGEAVEYAMLRHDNLFRGRVTRSGGMDTTPLKRFPCRHLREGLYVLWSGEVVPCREDVDAEAVLGRVDEGMDRIWRGGKTSALLGLHEREKWNESPLCGNCAEWYYTFL